ASMAVKREAGTAREAAATRSSPQKWLRSVSDQWRLVRLERSCRSTTTEVAGVRAASDCSRAALVSARNRLPYSVLGSMLEPSKNSLNVATAGSVAPCAMAEAQPRA